MECFRISEVSKTYGAIGGPRLVALQIGSLSIPAGGTTAVLGYSGSGKSTLLHILGLLDVPDVGGGDIRFNSSRGEISFRELYRSQELANQIRREGFGFVFQAGHLLGHLSAVENIGLPLALSGVPRRERLRRAEELLSAASLGDRRHARPHQLAGGEAQRVAVLRALAHEPQVILADEPTGNLDPDTGDRILKLLTDWREGAEGRTLIVVTHNFHQAFRFSDRFLMLRHGKIILRARKREVGGLSVPGEREIGDAKELFDALESSAASGLRSEGGGFDARLKGSSKPRQVGARGFWPLAAFMLRYAIAELLPTQGSSGRTKGRMGRPDFRSWIPTFVNILAVALLVFAGVVIGGTVIGSGRELEENITKTPRARCVEANCALGSQITLVDSTLLARIRDIPSESGSSSEKPVEAAYGWTDVAFWFFREDGGRDTGYTDGRTIDPGDPALEQLEFIGGMESAETPHLEGEEPGIIVSAHLLESLGYSPGDPPPALYVVYRDTRGRIAIKGVAKWIPGGEFAIAERFNRLFQDEQWIADPRYDHAFLGPLTQDQASKIREACDEILAERQVTAFVQERIGTSKWLRFDCPPGEAWSEVEFRGKFMPSLARAWGDTAILSMRTEFDPPIREADFGGRTPIDVTYTRASVYVSDLGALPYVVDALKGFGLGVDERLRVKMTEMNQVTGLGRGIFLLVVAIVAIISAANIYLTIAESIRRKTTQIGILKAYGAKKMLLLAIYAIEVILIWCAAAVVGSLVSLMSGQWIEGVLVDLFGLSAEWDLFQAPWWLIVGVLGGALGLCLAGALLAARSAATLEAAEAVRLPE